MRLTLISIILFSLSTNVLAVCMTEYDAEARGCKYLDDAKADIACLRSHTFEAEHTSSGKFTEYTGDDLKKYYPDSEDCTYEVAAILRGEEYEQPKEVEQFLDDSLRDKVVCLTHGKAKKNGCELWDYDQAYNECSVTYGDRYLPFFKSNKCSSQLADKLFGFTDPKELNKHLATSVEEAEAVMDLIDREQVKNSFAGKISSKKVIGNEFYNPVMKALLSNMAYLKGEFRRRSEFIVKERTEEYVKFVSYAAKYMHLLERIYKVYAYVAHRNDYQTKTFDFNKLEGLNLRMKKTYALELISSANYSAKHSYSGDYIDFSVYEQNKMIHEYQAIAEPRTSKEYAKLLVFMGIRENLTNLWAVDRLTPKDLFSSADYQCHDFLTVRPENRSAYIYKEFKHVRMSQTPVTIENRRNDTFSSYFSHIEELLKASREINVLDGEKAKAAIANTYWGSPELSEIIKEKYNDGKYIKLNEFEQYTSEDLTIMLESESDHWMNFSQYYFKSLVLPGDDYIDHKYVLVMKLVSRVFEERKKAIVDSFLALYPYLNDGKIAKIKKSLDRSVFLELKKEFSQKLTAKFNDILGDYADDKAQAKKRFDKKVKETLEASKLALKAAYIQASFDRGDSVYAKMKIADTQALMTLFEYKIKSQYHDIKLTLEKNISQANLLNGFFSGIIEEFNKKYTERNPVTGEVKYSGSEDERAKGLWKITFEAAQKIYESGRFDIAKIATLPRHTLLANEETRKQILASKNRIPVFEDGTPVYLTLSEFYATFNKRLLLDFDPSEVMPNMYGIFGMSDIDTTYDSYNADAIYAGKFGLPTRYYRKDGTKIVKNYNPQFNHRHLELLAKQSLALTQKEVRDNFHAEYDDQNEEWDMQAEQEIKEIKSPSRLFARIFEVLTIPVASLVKNNRTSTGFGSSKLDQKFLAGNELGKAYSVAPILRNTLETTESFTKTSHHASRAGYHGSSTYSYERKEKRPLLHKLALQAYSLSSGELDKPKAEMYIRRVIINAFDTVKGKLATSCKANYRNYLKDETFKNVFAYSAFLREKLKSPVGSTLVNAKRIRAFDTKMEKDLRSRWKAFVEDYVEPTLFWVGMVALAAGLVLLVIGSSGVALPAIIAGGIKVVSVLLTVEMYFSLVLITASLSVRINTQFIEMPRQLDYRESLANSQVEFSKIADHDMIDQARAHNNSARKWTIALMPLDLLLGATVVRHARKTLGISGRVAYKKLTGMKLRAYSAPVRPIGAKLTFQKLRRSNKRVRSVILLGKAKLKQISHMSPRHYDVPEGLIKSVPLRLGILRKLEKLRLAKKPWIFLDDVKAYINDMKLRLGSFDEFINIEREIVKRASVNASFETIPESITSVVEKVKVGKAVRLEGGLELRELGEYGLKYSMMNFLPKSAIRAIRKGEFKDWILNFKGYLAKMRILQGKLVTKRLKAFEGISEKMQQVQSKVVSGSIPENKATEAFLKLLSDKELEAFGTMVKRSRDSSQAQHLKSVFKNHRRLVDSLRPATYSVGHGGRELVGDTYRTSDDAFIGIRDRMDNMFDNDADDIANYYEFFMKHYGDNAVETKQLREAVEQELGKLSLTDHAGN